MSQRSSQAYGIGTPLPDRHLRSVKIQIDLSAIRANLATARHCSGGSRQFATIKADAYGHGAVAVAQALSGGVDSLDSDPAISQREHAAGDADGFAVVTLGEAMELRQAGIRQPILVLQGPQSADACLDMQQHTLWPVIHDAEQYNWYRQCVERQELAAWLKIDSGMGRLGVQPAEAEAILARDDGIRWYGVMTHFACADELDNPFTQHQINAFNTVRYSQKLQRSLANSAAVLGWPSAQADWARPGIMLYGCNPLDRPLPEDVTLTPAMTVKAPLLAVKLMTSGSGIGYAQTYHCKEDMPVGYAAAGYRDGIPRVLDSHAAVTVAGARCPIIGRVSMDSLAIDLRNAPGASTGDLVEFWGPDASIDELARAAGTINYELLTSIRGKRSYQS